jgi:DNA-binding beta-propeller fold protein YncE
VIEGTRRRANAALRRRDYPDGKRALIVKGGANRVGLLDIDGQKVNYTQVDGKNYDMATGLNPLNVQVTPDGKLAIVNNIGGGQDGQVDTVAVIDLEAHPPRVIDRVVVGDGPEGLAVCPAGGYAAWLILNGTGGTPKTAFNRHEKSYVALLRIDGKTVRRWRRPMSVTSPKASPSARTGGTFMSATSATATSKSCASGTAS